MYYVSKLGWEPGNSSGGENLPFLPAMNTEEGDEILPGHSRFASLENLRWELKGHTAVLVKRKKTIFSRKFKWNCVFVF